MDGACFFLGRHCYVTKKSRRPLWGTSSHSPPKSEQVSILSQTLQMISAPKCFHSSQGTRRSRDHTKTRSSCNDEMSPSIHAVLPSPLRTACAGHGCPLPTATILGHGPCLTDSVSALVALQQSFLTQACATSSSSLTAHYCCGVSIHGDIQKLPAHGAGQLALGSPAFTGSWIR